MTTERSQQQLHNQRKEVPMTDQPTVSVHIEMKVNLGNYESAGASIMLHNLPASATNEEIETLLETGRVAYEFMRPKLAAKIRELKAGK